MSSSYHFIPPRNTSGSENAETPVTLLTKRLSKASFIECNHLAGVSRFIESTMKVTDAKTFVSGCYSSLPADLDESANQEAPLQDETASWLAQEQFGAFTTALHPHIPLIKESSNSCSSGYYSSSSLSAPATCKNGRPYPFNLCENTNRDVPHTNHIYDIYESPTSYNSNLRRTKSCTAPRWLVKRRQLSQTKWPRISGILKDINTVPEDGFPVESALEASASCPPAYADTCLFDCHSPRMALIPVTHTNVQLNTPVEHSPTPTTPSKNLKSSHFSNADTPFRPLAKKQRLLSPACSNSTLLIPEDEQDENINHLNSAPLDVLSRRLQGKSARAQSSTFELIRHHSTPMPPTRSQLEYLGSISRMRIAEECKTKPTSPAPHSSPISSLHQLPQSHRGGSASDLVGSAPIPNTLDTDKLEHCIAAMDSQNICSDGRQPHLLPVLDRTASGLNCIDADAVIDLINGKYRAKHINFVVIDCRFPYEYEGGHIKDAINIFTHSDLVEEIFNRVPAQRPPEAAPGPPQLLGEGLAKRLALARREDSLEAAQSSSPSDYDSVITPEDDIEDCCINDSSELFHPVKEDPDLICPSYCRSRHPSEEEALMVQKEDLSIRNSITKHYTEPHVDSTGGPNLTTLSSSSESNGQIDPSFVVIFHCEFSSQRAPALAAFLRSIDRTSNYYRYPFLFFPEIYILKGGYSAFYQKFPQYCSPSSYITMFDRDFRNHLRLYKRLTKRVSSVCLDCVRHPRPLNSILHDDGKVEIINSSNKFLIQDSFQQLHKPVLASTSMYSPNIQKAGDICHKGASPSRLRRIATIAGPIPLAGLVGLDLDSTAISVNFSTNEVSNTSENCVGTASPVPAVQAASFVSQTETSSSEDSSIDSNVAGCARSGSRSDPDTSLHRLDCIGCATQNHLTFFDSPLGLAEAVVRAGRRIIAATMCEQNRETRRHVKKQSNGCGGGIETVESRRAQLPRHSRKMSVPLINFLSSSSANTTKSGGSSEAATSPAKLE